MLTIRPGNPNPKTAYSNQQRNDLLRIRYPSVCFPGIYVWRPELFPLFVVIRWDEKAGLRRDAVRSQVIDALEAQEIKETGNEEG